MRKAALPFSLDTWEHQYIFQPSREKPVGHSVFQDSGVL